MATRRPIEDDESGEREALALLAHRPRTEDELRRALAARGIAEDAIESTIARLRERGYVDDFALALHFLVSRAERLGHAPARLLAELRGRGVGEDVLGRVEREARETHGIDAERLVRREIERRGAGDGADPARNARVYNALLRAGYDAETLRAALGPGQRIGRRRFGRPAEDESDP